MPSNELHQALEEVHGEEEEDDKDGDEEDDEADGENGVSQKKSSPTKKKTPEQKVQEKFENQQKKEQQEKRKKELLQTIEPLLTKEAVLQKNKACETPLHVSLRIQAPAACSLAILEVDPEGISKIERQEWMSCLACCLEKKIRSICSSGASPSLPRRNRKTRQAGTSSLAFGL